MTCCAAAGDATPCSAAPAATASTAAAAPTASTAARAAAGCAAARATAAPADRRSLKPWEAMRIDAVHTAVVEANYDWTFVRVDAGDLSGIGECFCAPGLTRIIRDLAP